MNPASIKAITKFPLDARVMHLRTIGMVKAVRFRTNRNRGMFHVKHLSMYRQSLNIMKNSFKIQTSPCMVSLLGEVQTFKIGDRVEVYNTMTKRMSFVATIVGACTLINDKGQMWGDSCTLMNDNGQKWGNSLRSARVTS